MFGRDNHLPLNQPSSSPNSTGKKNEKRTDDIHHPNNQLNHNNNTCQSSSSSSSQKRPMNAFLIFCKRHRSVVKSKYPHLENRSITKILGEWWAALDADQKQTYTELARQYKEAFMKANPHFKWYKTDSFLSAPPKPSSLPSQPPVMIMSSSSPSKSSNGQQAVMNEEKKAVDDVKLSEEGSLKENKSNPTPKPPKKRYLETNEFKSTMKNNCSPAASTASSIPTPPSIQPVLDTDTMSRVIVDALTAGPNPPPSSYLNMNSIKTAAGIPLDSPSRSPSSPEGMKGSPSPSSHHPVMNGQSPPRHAVNGIHSPPLVCKESVSSLTAESLLIAESQQPIGSATALIASANKSNSCNSSSSIANSHTNTSGLVSVSASISVPMEEDDEDDDDDKPLNLSSSKVLRASNQQIIDHFIDKLLTTGAECGEGKFLKDEKEKTSLIVSDLSLIYSFESLMTGNPMPVEMMEHSASMNIVKQDTRMSSNCVNGGGSVSATKRPKSNSASSGHSSSSGDSETGNNQNKSKWVSGEFDLEERIAALPQLQDTHLINALNHKSSGLIPMNNGVNSRPANDLNGADIDMEVGPCDGLKALAEVPLGLQEAGRDLSLGLTIDLKRQPVRVILDQAFRGLGLSYMVIDGYLMIDSRTSVLEQRVELIDRKLDRVLDALKRLEMAK